MLQCREDNPMITTRIMRMLVGLTLLAMVTAGCGTLTGAAVGAGSGAAIGAGTGNAKKGALIGTGVGAAAGAIYDFTR
jgi:outer membrane lipoprotein SlyB